MIVHVRTDSETVLTSFDVPQGVEQTCLLVLELSSFGTSDRTGI